MRVCKICMVKFGFKPADKEKTMETDEKLYEHLENFHGLVVIRTQEGETEEQAKKRCDDKGLSSDRSKCRCEECKLLRGEESRITLTGFSPRNYVN